MKAFVSGQAGVAVLVSENRIRSYHLDATVAVERQEWELPLLFAGTTDVAVLEDASELQAVEAMELAWAKDRALGLSLILLDKDEEPTLRDEAAAGLEELFSNSAARDFVANRLYSAPISTDGDLEGARRCAEAVNGNRLLEFLVRLAEDQEEIAARTAAWNNLPISLFGSLAAKERFKAAAIQAGAFRLFVTERRKSDRALFQLLVHPEFRGTASARSVLLAWAAPFRESITNIEFSEEDLEDLEEGETRRPNGAGTKQLDGYAMFRRVEKQKTAIKELLLKGNRELALRFTQELVDSQRRASEREHVAMSLCDLAQFAKGLGDSVLQLDLSSWATREAPDDAWSHAQLGDAYRALGDYDKALDAFARAGALGDVRAALLGRAEVLKELGQLDEALSIFDRCALEFPEDKVARNGRASALARFGRLEEALQLYENLCKEIPVDVVSLAGRAEVLKDMGLFDQALAEFEVIHEMYPNEVVPSTARAEVLREMGRFEEALRVLDGVTVHFPLTAYPRALRARVLRDLGLYTEARVAYSEVISDFPLDRYAYIGIAELEKRQGNLSEALTAYRDVQMRFPRGAQVRNGLAAVLAALGRYTEALAMLPSHLPASLSEWIAYHIRGMTYMRQGELEKARQVFEHGVANNPWVSQRSYFQTALASLEIRKRRYKTALDLLKTHVAPAVMPIAAVLKMHAHGALGDAAAAEQDYRSAAGNDSVVLDLREALRTRFVTKSAHTVPHGEHALFQRECDILLLAA